MLDLKYLVRFDDICPTMNWRVWSEIEPVLAEHSVRPILAVIPDSRDLTLRWGRPHPRFWDEVRRWQAGGAAIGFHGFQHLYCTSDAGLTGFNPYSEFSGLGRAEQQRKIEGALAIFAAEGVKPDAWIAPGHSFDEVTLEVLLLHGINVVSDGHALYPFTDARGALWVPQQLDHFHRRPFGVWTVCLHHGWWTRGDIRRFARDIRKYAPRIASLPDVVAQYGSRRRDSADDFVRHMLRFRRWAGKRVRWMISAPAAIAAIAPR